MNILEFQMMTGNKIIEMWQELKDNKIFKGVTQEITIDGQEYTITLKKVKK